MCWGFLHNLVPMRISFILTHLVQSLQIIASLILLKNGFSSFSSIEPSTYLMTFENFRSEEVFNQINASLCVWDTHLFLVIIISLMIMYLMRWALPQQEGDLIWVVKMEKKNTNLQHQNTIFSNRKIFLSN